MGKEFRGVEFPALARVERWRHRLWSINSSRSVVDGRELQEWRHIGPAAHSLLEFNFEEPEFMSIDVDDVVAYPRRSTVGHPDGELRVPRTLRFDEP